MISDVLAVVHILQGHAAMGATVVITSKHFFWTTLVRGARQHVPSFGCSRRKRSTSVRSTGVRVEEFVERRADGKESEWLSENKMLETPTPLNALQLDVFVALWHLYFPEAAHDLSPPLQRSRASLSRS